MARLTREERQKLMDIHGIDRIWSWSRLNQYVGHPWAYRMIYLEKHKINTSNVYTEFGTKCHDLIQGMYEGECQPEEMSDLFNDIVVDWRLSDSSHQFMSDNVERGYIDNLEHYFANPEVIPYKLENERTIKIKVREDIIFIGYADSMYMDEDGVIHILDFKTSSKGEYTGKKLKNSSRQLLLYAIGVHQMTGLPYEKIVPQFDMMKYVSVGYLQKNGKWRESVQERRSWVTSQANRIRTILQDNGHDIFEIDDYIIEATDNNSLSSLPDYVQEKFKVGNCYIDVEVNEEIAQEFLDWICVHVDEIVEKEAQDWDISFPEPVIDESNRFYFEVLAKELLNYHEGYKEEKAIKQMRGKEKSLDDILDMIL